MNTEHEKRTQPGQKHMLPNPPCVIVQGILEKKNHKDKRLTFLSQSLGGTIKIVVTILKFEQCRVP